ncbi:MAG: Uma2 family endonuclease [Verrucomicrobiota bacterium]
MIAAKSKPRAKRAASRRWTFAELEAELPETTQPVELWDGELIMSPAPSYFHQKIVLRFYKVLDKWIAEHRLGEVILAPLDMVLSPHRSTQPDLLFVSHERRGILQDRVRGAADLVAEIISPESRRRDRIDKRDLYEQHGVREYWLIDPEAQTVEVLFLEKSQYKLLGRWRPGDKAQSKLLAGFTVPVGELFREE